MSHRPYTMRKRAQSAARTRQRLVEATFQLHTERGIAATTMQQIAERADVSIGTAYHHFSAYEDAIAACGAYAQERYRLPAPRPSRPRHRPLSGWWFWRAPISPISKASP